MKDCKRFTEKRSGENVIPLRNAICGVELPHWALYEKSINETFLYGDAVNRFAELEDKIENGTLVELHCKAGDKVYQVDNGGKIYENEIRSIYYANNTLIYDCGYFAFDERAIGKRIFLSEAEAEKRLEELKGR